MLLIITIKRGDSMLHFVRRKRGLLNSVVSAIYGLQAAARRLVADACR